MQQPTDLSDVARSICASVGLSYEAKVGEGAFKETFHAVDPDGEHLALKVYKPGYSRERSDREIHAMQSCDHPNIACLYSVATCRMDGVEYLYTTEEFVAGKTLTDHLEQAGLLPTQEVLSLGAALIGAVGHIESQGFVHRDIKPDNILLRQDLRTPVIVDFGIVRDLSAESLTSSWYIRGPGTPLYAAPEQLNNNKEQIDWRTDQFALGVVLSYCVLGWHPFSNAGALNPVQQVAQRSSPTGRFSNLVRRHGLPVLGRMVAPWPAKRYRTPRELIEAWNEQRED